jgi:hypothetical protein
LQRRRWGFQYCFGYIRTITLITQPFIKNLLTDFLFGSRNLFANLFFDGRELEPSFGNLR